MIPKLRLSDPRPIAPCELDTAQLAASEKLTAYLQSGSALTVVTGAAGSGRTRVLLHCAAGYPDAACVITPDRARATLLTDTAEVASLKQARPVMTLASLAFAILGQCAPVLGQPLPELLTGADEDALVRKELAEIIKSGQNWPQQLDAQVHDIDAFVRQTRAALARAYDLRITPKQLHERADQQEKPLWHLIAELQTRISRFPQIPFAAMLWRGEQALEEVARLGKIDELEGLASLLFVDDAQDLSAGGLRLLQTLMRHGRRVVATLQPDIATETYRDARPDLVVQWAQANDANLIDLGQSRRIGKEQLGAVNQLREHCAWLRQGTTPVTPSWVEDLAEQSGQTTALAEGLLRAEMTRKWETEVAGTEVALVNQPTLALVENYCLDQLIRWGIGARIAWENIAVLTRETQTAQRLADVFAAADIPLARRTSVLQFAQNPVTATILQILADPTDLEVVLRSPLAPVSPRWIEPILAGECEESTQLSDSLGYPASAETIKQYQTALRIQRCAQTASGNLLQDLWNVWEAADVAQSWRDEALAGSQIHDAWLDAAVALFRHADVYTQRNPEANTRQYCLEQLASKVAQDTIARGAPTDHGVMVGTVAQAAGRTFQRVIIVGLQEGNWPNPQVRDGIFQINHLENQLSDAQQYWNAYTDTLIGELRWLIAALSRSCGQTQIVYCENSETGPSFPVHMIAQKLQLRQLPASGESSARLDKDTLPTEFTQNGLRGVIAVLRNALIDPQEIARRATPGAEEIPNCEAEVLANSALLLAYLAKAGVNGADPRFWTGIAQGSALTDVLATSTAAPWERGARLSPSAIERMLECPLRWVLEKLGGVTSGSSAQEIGTFIHRLAEEYSDTQLAEKQLLQLFTERAEEEFAFNDELSQRRDKEHLLTCINSLTKYLVDAQRRKRVGESELIGAEVPVAHAYADVWVNGKIDRIERVGNATADSSESQPQTIPVQIVDFKTGKTPPTKAQTQQNAQLAVYQWLAACSLGYQPQGAKLVYLGKPVAKAPGSTVREQDEMGAESAEALLRDAAQIVHGAQFVALTNSNCEYCAFKTLCPNFYERTLP